MPQTEFTPKTRLSGEDIIKRLNINYSRLKAILIDLPNPPSYFDIYNKALYDRVKYIVQKLDIDNLLNQLDLVSITIILFEKQIISEKQLIDFLGPEFDKHLKSLGCKFSDQIIAFKSSIICSYSGASGNFDFDLLQIVARNLRSFQDNLCTASSNAYEIGGSLLSRARKFFESPPENNQSSINTTPQNSNKP